MEYRSTGTHYQNDIVAAAGSSHGVKLTGGSTGGVVEAVGDDANISLTLRGKGTGNVVLGNSSQGIVLGSAAAGSQPIKGAFSSTNTWALAAVSSGQVGELTFASTTFDVNPGDLIGAIEVWPTLSTTPLAFTHYRTSTVATSRLTVVLSNIASTATSTTSGHIRVSWFDLT
jgi:hypothetical protein